MNRVRNARHSGPGKQTSWPVGLLAPLLLLATLACAPGIALGPGSSNDEVAVNSAAAAFLPEQYNAVNAHIHMNVSGGVTVTGVSVDASSSVLPAPIFCAGPTVPGGLPNDRVFGCAVLGGGSTAAGGLLGALTFTATGNGCIVVSLVDTPGSPTLDTYTLGPAGPTPQTNTVDITTKRQVLVGTGSVGDCPS